MEREGRERICCNIRAQKKSHRAKERSKKKHFFYGGPEAAQIFLHCDP